MAKVILICGKICTGKSSYAQKIRREQGGVILSVDELMLALFGRDAGERHDEYTQKVRTYLFEKSVEMIQNGTNVILDWGFWTKVSRREAMAFYDAKGVRYELHCLNVSDKAWQARIDKRNREIKTGKADAYFVDESLLAKCGTCFEPPEREEVDVWVDD